MILAAYLFLCVPVRLMADACACAEGIRIHLFISVFGIGVRADYQLRAENGRIGWTRLYEEQAGARQRKRRMHRSVTRRLVSAMLDAAGSRKFAAYACAGLGDAAATALTTGALHAAMTAAAALWMNPDEISIRTAPAYGEEAPYLCISGILTAAPGDIISRMIGLPGRTSRGQKEKTAMKEGVLWTGIRSKA